jgi:hypothetical protein
VLLPRAGFVIFNYVIDTHALFSIAVFVFGIVVTEWASIASTLGVADYLAARFGTEECAVEDDLTDAQAAALSTMAAAFNQTCSDVLGEFKGKASACDCE